MTHYFDLPQRYRTDAVVFEFDEASKDSVYVAINQYASRDNSAEVVDMDNDLELVVDNYESSGHIGDPTDEDYSIHRRTLIEILDNRSKLTAKLHGRTGLVDDPRSLVNKLSDLATSERPAPPILPGFHRWADGVEVTE